MLNFLRHVRSAYIRSFSGLPQDAWWLSLAFFVYRSGTMVLPFFVLYLTTQLGYSHTAAGRFMALYGLGSIAGSLLGGRLIGWVGARRVLIVSYLATGGALLALAVPREPWALGGLVLLFSLVAEIGRPATAAAATNSCPEASHTKALALNRLAVNLGMTVGPAFGGFLTIISYTWLFVVDAVTCWLSAMLLIWRFGRSPEVTSRSSSEQEPAERLPCRNPWTDQRFLLMASLTTSQAFVFFQLLGTYPMYLKEVFHFTERDIGLVFGLNTLCVVLFEMVLLDFVSRYRDIHVIAVGSFLTCLGFGLLAFGDGWSITIISVLVWTLGEMLTMPLTAAFVSRMARNPIERGRYFGAYTSCYSVAFVVAPILGTAIYAIRPSAVWWWSLAVAPLLMTGYLLLGIGKNAPVAAECR
jgi:MFS family permease